VHYRQALNKQKQLYQQQLPVQMVTAVLVLDRQLKIQYANPSAEALLGRSFSRLFQQGFNDAFAYSSLGNSRLKQLLEKGQEFTDSEVVFEFIDQQHITVELTASLVEFNQQCHILLEIRRVDSQKQISLEAFQNQQWEAARDLIRGLAHEIKNPLGGLRGAAQLLNRELSAQQQEYTQLIIEQADRLTQLVDNLLGPNQLPNFENGNIHKVLETIYQLVTLDNSKNIIFKRDYDPSIPDSLFDQNKLQQAILNIVSNAVQVLDDRGEITLKTRIASNQTINGKRIRLSIQISIIDNGPGIPANIQDTLFYPMVSARENGTGMGLSIAQTLIHQHQGKLSCNSYPGRTEFMILLPFPKENSV
jgi:two-component system nitrogen regulation sensor histidine kinase GlnL